MKPCIHPTHLLAAAATFAAISASAQTFSFSFGYGADTNTLAAAESAGFVPALNWNNVNNFFPNINVDPGNLPAGNGTGRTWIDDTGANSAITLFSPDHVTPGDSSAFRLNGTTTGGSTTSADEKMMRRALGLNSQSSVAVSDSRLTVAAIPQSLIDTGYEVIVYINSMGTGAASPANVLYTASAGGQTFFFTDTVSDDNFTGSFDLISSTTAATAQGGNMLRFTGLNTASFTLTFTNVSNTTIDGIFYLGNSAGNLVGLTGLQIVPIPEPATTTALAAAAALAAGIALRRRRG